MTIEKIFIAKERGAPQESVDAVRVVVGRGVEGDRNFRRSKYPGQNITFVEAEEIEHFNETSGIAIEMFATRRNVVTRGVRLDDLVGREFRIGDARFKGVELCEPCSVLGARLKTDALSAAGIVRLLKHRAGLRADVLATGTIRVGDPFRSD